MGGLTKAREPLRHRLLCSSRRGYSALPETGDQPISRYSLAVNTFTAVFEKAEEGGYVAFVEELPGAISQGETLEEARENLKEAVELILEVNRERVLDGVDEQHVIREQLVVGQ